MSEEVQKQINIKVKEEQGRIDKFLSDYFEDLSRSKIKRLIKQNKVLVNNSPIKVNYKIKNNDDIIISIPKPKPIDIKAEDIPIDILYEDSDIAIVNKPQGMVVHPAVGNRDGTLVNALLYHIKDLSGINGEIRPGIVHRLDKDTSGILVVAKNDEAHVKLSEQFQKRTVTRKYLALVHGVLAHSKGTINAPIGRDKNNRQKFTVTTEGKEAITHFSVEEYFNQYSLLNVSLETGRTHQIRVHLKYINHAVAGDLTYGPKNTLIGKGQFLHAHSIGFIHPRTEKKVYFEAPLPKILEETLINLEKQK